MAARAILAFIVACGGWTSAAAVEMQTARDLPYAGDSLAAHTLDIYSPPKGERPHPVVVFLHGGAWRIGDKAHIQEKPQAFVNQGYLFVSLNYRMTNETSPREQAADVALAIHWLRDHLETHGGDPEQLYLMGHSAGAHLTALVATDERFLKARKLPLSVLKGAILLDGAAYDVPRQLELARLPRMQEMYRTVFSEDTEQQRAASPITYVAADKGIPPFLILYVASRRDGTIQSTAFAEKLKAAGVTVQLVAAESKTHATINRELGLADDAPTQAVWEFLKTRRASLPTGATRQP